MQHVFTINGQHHEAWLGRRGEGHVLHFGDRQHTVALAVDADGSGVLTIDGQCKPVTLVASGNRVWIHLDGADHEILLQDPVEFHGREADGAAHDTITAPMPGVAIAVRVAAGDVVKAGDTLLIIESMKLETVIRSPRDGQVELVGVSLGQSFERDAVLVTLVADS